MRAGTPVTDRIGPFPVSGGGDPESGYGTADCAADDRIQPVVGRADRFRRRYAPKPGGEDRTGIGCSCSVRGDRVVSGFRIDIVGR